VAITRNNSKGVRYQLLHQARSKGPTLPLTAAEAGKLPWGTVEPHGRSDWRVKETRIGRAIHPL